MSNSAVLNAKMGKVCLSLAVKGLAYYYTIMTQNQNAALFHCNAALADRRQIGRHSHAFWSRILTQAAVAEVLSQADVAQLAGRDLSDLQSHGGALAHRLHAHAHRLHLQHQHRHLQAREHADDDVRTGPFGSVLTDRPAASGDLPPCLWWGRRCSGTWR